MTRATRASCIHIGFSMVVAVLGVMFPGIHPPNSFASETLPPVPEQYFNDYAKLIPPQIAEDFNLRLSESHREHSVRILVVVYPARLSDAPIAPYTLQLAQSWSLARTDFDLGAVLFVFLEDRELFLQVTDRLKPFISPGQVRKIIDNEIKQHFKGGDYQAGLASGIDAILDAATGEYHGIGSEAAEPGRDEARDLFVIILILIFLLLYLIPAFFRGMFPFRKSRTK